VTEKLIDTVEFFRDLQRLRRQAWASQPFPDNSKWPAGQPMIFRCEACLGPVVVAEDWVTKPAVCEECEQLAALEKALQ
jgi:hypothetical protein